MADLEEAAVAIARTSLAGRLRWVNRAFCAMTGYSRAEALQLGIRDLTGSETIDLRTASVGESGRPLESELRIRTRAGALLWVGVATSLVRDADGRARHLLSVFTDISQRKRAEQEASRFSAAMDATVDAIVLSDPAKGRILYVNEGACKALGYAREELLRKPIHELLGTGPEQLDDDREAILLAGERGVRSESRFVRRDGSEGWMDLHRRAVRTPDGTLIVTIARNISERKEQQEKIERLTRELHDELTGLANHRLLMERLGQLLLVAGRAHEKLAISLLDVERLRAVNKSFGRRTGDALLRQIGERLTRSAGAGLVARHGSDHFVLVLANVGDRSGAERQLALHLRACFAAPYTIDGVELKVGVKAGLAVFPSDGSEAETLLVNAEAALRQAKQSGERYVFYTSDIGERTGVWLSLESKLARALERAEFVLHYQPKVDTLTRRIAGLEALIRWQSPDLGLVAPDKFIPLMEETGMILDVGAWALRRAALDQRRWSEHGFDRLRVAVNVSVVQLRQRRFVDSVEQAIREGVRPSGIDLEMTESLIMEDIEENIRKLEAIRALGVQVAIDDFGTGYSSLAYLAKLPVQVLKIDRSFIATMLSDPGSLTLVQTIISLAHALRLKVVAEGVEQEEQARYLGLLRCDQIQGHLVSRPLPFEEMMLLLRKSAAAAHPPRG